MTIYQGLNFCGQSNLSKSMKWWDLGPFEDKQAGLVQSMGAKGKTSWEAVEIGTCQSRIYPNLAFCCAKSAECIDSWFHQDLARRNWKAVFISLIELQILWLEWSQMAESTDTWLWQSAPSAPCQVAYPSILLHSHISVSPATCHTVQCRANMRVADCNNCWEAVEIGTW